MVVQKNQKEAASIETAQTFHAEEEQEGNQCAWFFAIEVGEGSESQVLNKSKQPFSETENDTF